MKSIKVRAWDTHKLKMYSAEELGGDEMQLNPNGSGFFNASPIKTSLSEYYQHLLPLEFIGQTDRNGIEIYDGDVVHYMFDFDDEKLKKKAKRYKGFVVWCQSHCAFEIANEFDDDHGFVFNSGNFCDVEVIGNIYENPELQDTKKIEQ